jgi:translocation and assembly module TamB
LVLSLVWRLTWAPLSLLLVAVLAVTGFWALLHGEWLTRQVLPQVPGLSVVAPRGALLGDFEADRLELDLPRGGRLIWQQPRWQGLELVLDRSAPWWLGLQAGHIGGQRIDIQWVPDPQAGPTGAPTDLSLPVSLTFERVEIGELHGLTGDQALKGLDAALRLGAMRHAVKLRQLSWSDWTLSGDVGLGGRGDMPLEVDLLARGRREASADAVLAGAGELSLRARGPLRDFSAQLDVRWQPERGAAQGLSADIGVRPFAPWPLARGHLATRDLDLASLVPAWPRTQVAGRIDFDDRDPKDWVAKLDVRNGLPGAWDQGRLPWLAVKGALSLDRALAARADADTWREVRTDLVLTLSGRQAQQPARLSLKGPLMGRQPLLVGVQDLAPRALLGALPDLLLGGELRWTPVAGAKDLAGALDLRLSGAVHALPGKSGSVPVQLEVRSQLSAQRWAVQRLQLASGEAKAQLEESVVRWGLPATQGGWAASGRMLLDRFDPRAWLPWPAALTGATSLSGSGRFDVDGTVAGLAELTLSNSSLAGVPLQAQLNLAAPKSSRELRVDAQASLAGNQVRLQGQGDRSAWGQPGAPQAPGRWQLRVQAADIASLSPWAAALGGERLKGQLSLDAQGSWPLRSLSYRAQGRDIASVRGEQEALRIGALDGEGELDLARAQGPMSARWSIQDMRLPGWVQSRLGLVVSGSAAEHLIRLEGEGAPIAGGQVDASRAVRLSTQVAGRWQASTSQSSWQADVREAVLAWTQARGRPPLLRLAPTQVRWQADARQTEWRVAGTRVQAMGLDGLLERVIWRTPVGEAPVQPWREAALTLPPFAVAPWLALWAPDEGWAGDLTASGSFKLLQQGDQAWDVDVRLARQAGDLSFAEPGIEGGRAQRLGLREARLSLRARQGVWVAEQHIDGRVLGLLTGRQVVQALRADALPDASSTLAGEVRLDVANLRALATWVPAGWRLGGRALAHTRLGGTLGAPQFVGEVEGSGLSASQALLGISIQDGSLHMALDGERVRLNRFEATSGPQGGRLSIDADLQLASPLSGRVGLKMDRFAALQRVDRRLVLSGEGETTLRDWQMLVRGQFGVDEGFIDISRGSAATLGDDVTVINRPGEAAANRAPAKDANGPKQLVLDTELAVKLGDRLRLSGHGLSGALKGQVVVSTPRNKPAIHGSIRLDQGKFAAYGQKLDIQRSSITFSGLIENPRLDILAMRPQSPTAQDSDVKVGVRITGTAQDPRIRLYSEPTLSETEQLSWLVLGRGPTGLGGADIGLLQSAAVALLSGDDGPGATDRIIGLLGLDNLSVSQSDGAVSETVVSVGKQISRHWYMGYERNLSATGGNWQLIYSLARRFKVRAQAGEDNALDFIWQWRWR